MSTDKGASAASNGTPSKDKKEAEAKAVLEMQQAKAKFDKLYTLMIQRKAVTTHLETLNAVSDKDLLDESNKEVVKIDLCFDQHGRNTYEIKSPSLVNEVRLFIIDRMLKKQVELEEAILA